MLLLFLMTPALAAPEPLMVIGLAPSMVTPLRSTVKPELTVTAPNAWVVYEKPVAIVPAPPAAPTCPVAEYALVPPTM